MLSLAQRSKDSIILVLYLKLKIPIFPFSLFPFMMSTQRAFQMRRIE